jgi:hypothetical protein
MPGTLETAVRALFDAYGRLSAAAMRDPDATDAEGVVAAFADYFVGSSPRGVAGSANDAAFKGMIAKGFAHYRAVGGTAMTITGVEIEELDALHALARVGWDFAYTNKAGESGHVAFTNLYFVTIAGGAPKIFAYITPDEQGAMQAHGLV